MKRLLTIVTLLVSYFFATQQIDEETNSPSFTLKTENGAPMNFSKFISKVVFLSFFAAWCGFCKKELSRLKKLFKRKSANGNFMVLVVAVCEDYRIIWWFNIVRGLSLSIFPDLNMTPLNKYSRNSIPYIVLIDHQGGVCSSYGIDKFIERRHKIMQQSKTPSTFCVDTT